MGTDRKALDEGASTITGNRLEFITHSPEETIELGARLARELPHPSLVVLEGDLGSGKTTLVKGIVSGMGVARQEEVTSPSFTLVHEYGTDRKVYHADLYRIEGAREVATLGLEDLLEQEATVIVEWGEKLIDLDFAVQVRIRMELLEGENRRVTIEGLGA
ncbi:MAG TPA: tRNA (adenosine(37)-N6)-threonylcarbamoyltransferase complex ATPase subunit type 1 TsaE [Terriglobia bacterium]|jgi:tRNA threonylcarbamoyladenosine biosynthesis protein TsaE|nr:tRNA (adenosine(37)-N6)-threonylcarbamoyltransferase complex ATPase subunit type 1 TsaE [Terriglobia bacterium]